MLETYGTAPVTPGKKRPGEPDDGSMTVTTMDGPAASVPAPASSPAGPQLKAPTTFTPPQTPTTSPVLAAGASAVAPNSAPAPVAAAPTIAPTLSGPGAAAPTPIPFGPTSVAKPQSTPIQGWGQSAAVVTGDNGQIVGDSTGSSAARTQRAVDAAAANDAAHGGVLDERWASLAARNKAIADGMAIDANTGAVAQPSVDRVDPASLPNNGIVADQHAISYAGPPLRPNDPAYMAEWNKARGTTGAAAIPPNAGSAPPGGADLPSWLADLAKKSNPDGLLMGGASTPINFGPSTATGAQNGGTQGSPFPTTLPATSGAAGGGASTAVPGLSTSAITGDETPYSVNPTQSAGLSQLLARAQAAVNQGLDSPTAWDDPLAASVKDAARRGIDNNYEDADQSLSAELAQRGLSYSDIASKRYLDLKGQKANALTDLDTNIATQRANSLASGRSAALSAAMNAIGMNAGLESSYRTEQRGERGYVDDLKSKAQNDALTQTVLGQQFGQQNFQNILQLIQQGMGYGQNGANLLGSAGAGYGYAGGQYGQQADSGNAQLGGLAELAMRLYGGGG